MWRYCNENQSDINRTLQNFKTKNIKSLAIELGNELAEQNKKVATVESCTGGGIAFAITEVAGSSAWFEKSWVTYSNQAKHEEVGVLNDTLSEFGAVSAQTVEEMAAGGLHASGADLCVAVSGIAGPDGGSPEKPVGLVWFAIASATSNITGKATIRNFSRCFNGDRAEVREQAISLSLKELIDSTVSA
ncbi:nicotinamide-nucleotide amidohydrolase family protein [Glaciecola sp. MH2013]|uniref:CinA family protein n=1 Tax=Glaciecola sp. MH2013 TaxID=2785524 RepID=UPI00189DD006|nr:nicotinamide-nucleotide amidohydrolase family protein [Glaciecola sp. MH2013]MBF7072194.1 nicotinamide-nucleotide amidohydrolase family protein [Glaciecola sp. MH2013]